MKEKKQENSKFLKKKRKYIETVFSKLVNLFDIEKNKSTIYFRISIKIGTMFISLYNKK